MADVVPLTGENRLIVKKGLKFIQAGSRPGIRALKEVSGLSGKRQGQAVCHLRLCEDKRRRQDCRFTGCCEAPDIESEEESMKT